VRLIGSGLDDESGCGTSTGSPGFVLKVTQIGDVRTLPPATVSSASEPLQRFPTIETAVATRCQVRKARWNKAHP
jgi:hypothetical protein